MPTISSIPPIVPTAPSPFANTTAPPSATELVEKLSAPPEPTETKNVQPPTAKRDEVDAIDRTFEEKGVSSNFKIDVQA